MEKNCTISVLSLNIWGVPLLTIKKSVRVRAIGKMIVSNAFDVVCLQEVWCKEDYKIIKDICKSVLPYTHYYHSGFCGSGLCIFSKWPIIKTFFSQWSLNGYIHMIFHADWYGGKGVAFAQICYKGHNINIYNTHLIAKYSNEDIYETHRLVQALDTAMLINITSSNAMLSIVCGDLNVPPENICTRLITHIGDLRDTYEAKNKSGKEDYGTNDLWTNSFSRKQTINTNGRGTRIDYIFYKPGNDVKVELISYDLPNSKIQGSAINFSDHEPVLVYMKILPSQHTLTVEKNGNKDFDLELLNTAIGDCKDGIESVKKNWLIYLIIAMLLMVTANCLVICIPSYNIFFAMIVYPLSIYCFVMASIWYRMEINGIVGAIKRLKNLEKAICKIKNN